MHIEGWIVPQTKLVADLLRNVTLSKLSTACYSVWYIESFDLNSVDSKIPFALNTVQSTILCICYSLDGVVIVEL